MPFVEDTIPKLYDELEVLQGAIAQSALDYKTLANEYANAVCDYEDAKGRTLIALKAEEDATSGLKRTESVREAMYRTEHADLRRKRTELGEAVRAEKVFLDALANQLTATQTRIRLVEFQERGTQQ